MVNIIIISSSSVLDGGKNTINSMDLPVRINYIVYAYILTSINILILMFGLTTWFYTNYVNLKTELKFESKSNIYKRIAASIFSSGEVIVLVWNLVFGILGVFYPFFFAIQILSVIQVISIMKIVLDAIQQRYKQFLAVTCLILATTFIYAYISQYFFRSNFEVADTNENHCSSQFKCFLTLINQGLRAGGGLGFGLKSVEEEGYWSEVIFNWIFYFTLTMLMMGIFSGIIVDTFSQLREDDYKKDEVLQNNCFICNASSTNLESSGINFENHVEKDHSIKIYVMYLLNILTTPRNELNSEEYIISKMINISNTSFFPVSQE